MRRIYSNFNITDRLNKTPVEWVHFLAGCIAYWNYIKGKEILIFNSGPSKFWSIKPSEDISIDQQGTEEDLKGFHEFLTKERLEKGFLYFEGEKL